MCGKGNNHLLPILIPPDTVEALKKIANEDFRKVGSVLSTNKFLFASSLSSESHVSGWHAVNSVCQSLDLKSGRDIIATKNRHRISPLFASLDVPKNDRDLFYSHMGHSEDINKDMYQANYTIFFCLQK